MRYQINNTHSEKLFYSIQYKNGCLASSDLFRLLHNQLSLSIPLSCNNEYRCLDLETRAEPGLHQI